MRFHAFGLRVLAIVAGSTALALLITPSPAMATGVVDSWAVDGSALVNDVQEAATGEGQGVLVGTASEAVAFSCQAVSLGVVAATGVGCYMHGLSDGQNYFAPSIWAPGTASATAGSFVGAVQTYLLCIGYGNVDINTGSTKWTTLPCQRPI